MRITTKGQVTIPQHIREKLGIPPATEVEFVEENGIGAAYPRCQPIPLLFSSGAVDQP
jgi:AbrB family looped-hinge helix DNA binding protein